MSVSLHGESAKEKQVIVDTTVQENNITYPTDGRLAIKIINHLIKIAKKENIKNILVTNGFESSEVMDDIVGLIDGMNIDKNRIKVVTFGESNPICLEQTDECWKKNRRVDFKMEE